MGPLSGITVLDLSSYIAGPYGCSLLAEHVADHDCNVTRRFKDAGFVIVGTTTLPEYGILPVSEASAAWPST